MSRQASDRVPLARPPLAPEAEAAVLEVLRSGALVRGARVEAFEADLSGWLSGQPVLAVASGTAALEVALAALGLGAGDEVVMPDFTFPSLANAIVHLGARPVTVDISLETLNAGPEALLAAVGSRTRAVVPVHQFGLPDDLAPLLAAGREQGFAVVEDAACAFGGRLADGRPCGTAGQAGCFSFHPRKPVTTGEGGAVTAGAPELFAAMARLANHGMTGGPGFLRFVAPGWNYRMSNLHAAVATGQLARLGQNIARRRALAARYVEKLAGQWGLVLPGGQRDPAHIFQSFVVLVEEGIDRERLIEALGAGGVESTIGSYAVHLQPLFREGALAVAPAGGHPNAASAFARSLALPMFEDMSETQQDQVLAALARGLAAQRG